MNTGVWYLETLKHIHETSDKIININYLSLAITCVFFLDTAIWLRKIYYQNENQKEKAILLQSALLNKKIKFYVSDDEEETSEKETSEEEETLSQEEKAENESSEEQVQNEENESSEEDDVSDDNYIEQEEDYIENEDNVFTKEMGDELSNLLNTLENNTCIISEKLSVIYKENNIEEPPQ